MKAGPRRLSERRCRDEAGRGEGGLSAAKSEHDALAAALEHGGGSAIASLSAEQGYERALAAALGEDVDATVGDGESSRRWPEANHSRATLPLPAGTECLADHVRAPARIDAAAQQIAVADEDKGQPSQSVSGSSRAME